MPRKKNEVPIEYTEIEGGGWKPWESPTGPGRKILDNPAGFEKYDMSSNGTATACGVKFHALRYKDGREWDFLNGWREVLPPKNQVESKPIDDRVDYSADHGPSQAEKALEKGDENSIIGNDAFDMGAVFSVLEDVNKHLVAHGSGSVNTHKAVKSIKDGIQRLRLEAGRRPK